jgi:hypothetical protein
MARLNRYGMKHHWLTAFRMGKLVPFFLQEVSPGDIWKGFSNAIFRLAPMNHPVFVQMSLHAHIFYCPYRLLFDEFPEVWTGEDTTTAWPTKTYSISDAMWPYFGVPLMTLQTPSMNLMPVRCYNLIWESHFMNPLEQGLPSIDYTSDLHAVHHASSEYYGSIQTELAQGGSTSEQVTVSGGVWDVVDYRDAMNRQRYKERRAAYGERYEDVLLTEHGVDISDVRLQQPEHCARGRAVMGISEVVATASSTSETTGEMKGHGITGMRLNFPARKFPEPGLLMGVIYGRPRLQLNTGIDRLLLQNDHEELFHPHLSSDTQTTVSTNEIFANIATPTSFGYIGKYDHLRKPRDMIAGLSEVEDMAAYRSLTSVPTVAFLHQVQDYSHLFQDAGSSRADFKAFFDHRIGKLSSIPRRKK